MAYGVGRMSVEMVTESVNDKGITTYKYISIILICNVESVRKTTTQQQQQQPQQQQPQQQQSPGRH